MSLHDDADAGEADEEIFDGADDEGDDDQDDGADAEEGEGEDDPDADDDGEEDSDDDGADPRAQAAIERVAKEAGWKPKKDWKGEGWVPADQFLKNAANRAKHANQRAKQSERAAEERIARLENASNKTLQLQADQFKARAAQLRRDVIRDEKDPDKAAELIEAIDKVLGEELEKLKPPAPAKAEDDAPIQLSALDKSFFGSDAGAWIVDDYEDDEEAEAEADEAMSLVQTTLTNVYKKTNDIAAAYDAAERALKKAFPHRYEEERKDARGQQKQLRQELRRRAPHLGGGHSAERGAGGGDRSVERLPPEAKRAAADSVKRGIYGSEKEYAEVYWAELKKERRA